MTLSKTSVSEPASRARPYVRMFIFPIVLLGAYSLQLLVAGVLWLFPIADKTVDGTRYVLYRGIPSDNWKPLIGILLMGLRLSDNLGPTMTLRKTVVSTGDVTQEIIDTVREVDWKYPFLRH